MKKLGLIIAIVAVTVGAIALAVDPASAGGRESNGRTGPKTSGGSDSGGG